jgi:hypothetical protein
LHPSTQFYSRKIFGTQMICYVIDVQGSSHTRSMKTSLWQILS